MQAWRIIILAIAIALYPMGVAASGVPESIELTPSNVAKFGFKLVDDGIDSASGVRTVTLKFPSKIRSGWLARRVQTYLLDERGEQLAGTSSDYQVSGSTPSVLAHYPAEKYDLAFVIQYFCKKGGGYGCAEAYVLESVNTFLKATAAK